MLTDYQIQLKCQIIANQISSKVKLPFVKVKLVQSSDEYKGEYFFKQNVIYLYKFVKNKKMTFDDIKSTLYHECAHHYQYCLYNNLKHNKRFYDTIVLLKLLSL